MITLGRLAHHPEHTIYCLPRLLDAALTDERPSDYDPQHPRRMVMDLLKHRGQDGGPLQKITMDWLVQRLEQRTTGPNGPWAVTALATVLSRSGEIVRFEGRRMSLGGFSLAPLMHHIADRRAAVLRLLRRVGGGAEIGQGAAAIKALENLLHRPFPPFGGVVPPEQVAVWEPEARKAADLLAEIAGRGESPVLRYAARRALRSSTHDHWPEAAKHVIEALAGTPPSPDEPLYDLLASEPLTERDPDRADKTSPAERPAKRVARALWQSYQTPIAVLQRLSGAITEIAITVGVNGVGRPFLGRAVVGARVPQAPALVDALLALPPAQSLCLVADIVGGLTEHCDRGLLKDAVARLAASPVESLRAECAQGLWWLPHRSNGTLADFALMDPFISDPSPTVRLAAANALMAFAHIDEDRSIDSLFSIEWDGREDIADTVCSRFASWGEPPTLSASDERIDRLLLRIETLPSLDHRQHTVAQFIAGASFNRPLQTVEMLLRRVQRADSPPDSPSRPVEAVPDPSHGPFRLHGLARSAEFLSLLRRIRDLSLVSGEVGQHAAKNLFQAAATNVPVAVDALREWVESGDSVKILRSAEMLPGLHHSRVFTLRDFVADILEAAAAAGTECHQRVVSALWAISIGGVFSAIEGEPPPRHLDDKAQAEQLAAHFANRPVVAAFYQDLAKSSQRSIERHIAEWVEAASDW